MPRHIPVGAGAFWKQLSNYDETKVMENSLTNGTIYLLQYDELSYTFVYAGRV